MYLPKGKTKKTEETKMRYIDKTGCKSAFEKGADKEVTSLGKLTKAACKIAKENKLGVLKTRQGAYRIIKESGLGAYEDFFTDLAEVDEFLKHLDEHEATRY